MQRERTAKKRGHHPARKSHIPAETEHDVRPDAADMARALPERVQEVRGQEQLLHQALTPRRLGADPCRRISVPRHEAFLHSAACAHPDDLPSGRARLLGDGDPGKDMPAGSARHDEKRAANAANPRASWRFSQSMRSRMGSATKLITRPEPP